MKKDKTPLAAWQSQYHTSTPPKVITFQIKVFNSCKEHMSGQKTVKKPSKYLREQLSLPNQAISTVSGTLTPFRYLFTQSTQNTSFNSFFF